MDYAEGRGQRFSLYKTLTSLPKTLRKGKKTNDSLRPLYRAGGENHKLGSLFESSHGNCETRGQQPKEFQMLQPVLGKYGKHGATMDNPQHI